MNSSIKAYFRAYINKNQNNWDKWDFLAKFIYNNTLYSVIGITLFYISDSRHQNFNIISEAPKVLLKITITTAYNNYMAGINAGLINKLKKARELARKYYNKYYLNIEFKAGDLIILKYTNIKTKRTNKKLNYRKLGSYYI